MVKTLLGRVHSDRKVVRNRRNRGSMDAPRPHEMVLMSSLVMHDSLEHSEQVALMMGCDREQISAEIEGRSQVPPF
jgi:hypothetical protein